MSSPILDFPKASALDLFSGEKGDNDYKAFKDELCSQNQCQRVQDGRKQFKMVYNLK